MKPNEKIGRAISDRGLPVDNHDRVKRPNAWGRFFIERKHSMTPYGLAMLFGAAVGSPAVYGYERMDVWIRIRRRLYRTPRWAIILALPFNQYWPGIKPWQGTRAARRRTRRDQLRTR